MRIVITGGAGFIGKKLARALLVPRHADGPARAPCRRCARSRCSTSSRPRACRDDPRLRDGRRRHHRSGRGQGADRARHGRRVPSRGDRQRQCRGGLRSRLPGQSRRHPPRARGLPRAAGADQAGVRELGRGLWRRDAGGAGRHDHPDAADLLRRPEGGGRAAAQRLQPQGLRRRPRAAPADHRGAPRQAQPGGLDLRELDHPRAARRRGRRSARSSAMPRCTSSRRAG